METIKFAGYEFDIHYRPKDPHDPHDSMDFELEEGRLIDAEEAGAWFDDPLPPAEKVFDIHKDDIYDALLDHIRNSYSP
jgi:hypothetical protein